MSSSHSSDSDDEREFLQFIKVNHVNAAENRIKQRLKSYSNDQLNVPSQNSMDIVNSNRFPIFPYVTDNLCENDSNSDPTIAVLDRMLSPALRLCERSKHFGLMLNSLHRDATELHRVGRQSVAFAVNRCSLDLSDLIHRQVTFEAGINKLVVAFRNIKISVNAKDSENVRLTSTISSLRTALAESLEREKSAGLAIATITSSHIQSRHDSDKKINRVRECEEEIEQQKHEILNLRSRCRALETTCDELRDQIMSAEEESSIARTENFRLRNSMEARTLVSDRLERQFGLSIRDLSEGALLAGKLYAETKATLNVAKVAILAVNKDNNGDMVHRDVITSLENELSKTRADMEVLRTDLGTLYGHWLEQSRECERHLSVVDGLNVLSSSTAKTSSNTCRRCGSLTAQVSLLRVHLAAVLRGDRSFFLEADPSLLDTIHKNAENLNLQKNLNSTEKELVRMVEACSDLQRRLTKSEEFYKNVRNLFIIQPDDVLAELKHILSENESLRNYVSIVIQDLENAKFQLEEKERDIMRFQKFECDIASLLKKNVEDISSFSNESTLLNDIKSHYEEIEILRDRNAELCRGNNAVSRQLCSIENENEKYLLEIQNLRLRITQMDAEYTDGSIEILKRIEELEKRNSENKLLESSLKSTIENQGRELISMSQSLEILNTEVQSVTAEKSIAVSRNQTLEQDIQRLESHISQLLLNNHKLEADVASQGLIFSSYSLVKEKEVSIANENLANYLVLIEKQSVSNFEHVQRLSEIENELIQRNLQVESVLDFISKHAINSFNVEISPIKLQTESISSKLEELFEGRTYDLDSMKFKLKELSCECSSYKALLDHAKLVTEELKERLLQIEAEFSEQRNSLTAEVQLKAVELNSLQETTSNLVDEYRQQLLAKDSRVSELESSVGSLSSILENVSQSNNVEVKSLKTLLSTNEAEYRQKLLMIGPTHPIVSRYHFQYYRYYYNYYHYYS